MTWLNAAAQGHEGEAEADQDRANDGDGRGDSDVCEYKENGDHNPEQQRDEESRIPVQLAQPPVPGTPWRLWWGERGSASCPRRYGTLTHGL